MPARTGVLSRMLLGRRLVLVRFLWKVSQSSFLHGHMSHAIQINTKKLVFLNRFLSIFDSDVHMYLTWGLLLSFLHTGCWSRCGVVPHTVVSSIVFSYQNHRHLFRVWRTQPAWWALRSLWSVFCLDHIQWHSSGSKMVVSSEKTSMSGCPSKPKALSFIWKMLNYQTLVHMCVKSKTQPGLRDVRPCSQCQVCHMFVALLLWFHVLLSVFCWDQRGSQSLRSLCL